jgi:hypothetical protein
MKGWILCLLGFMRIPSVRADTPPVCSERRRSHAHRDTVSID